MSNSTVSPRFRCAANKDKVAPMLPAPTIESFGRRRAGAAGEEAAAEAKNRVDEAAAAGAHRTDGDRSRPAADENHGDDVTENMSNDQTNVHACSQKPKIV